ncbi:hypothetical protein G6F66_014280 [Rhizopus arrhizus]|nr:hypothetical protein G6F66_014280 [Rhizopus arrhizus]
MPFNTAGRSPLAAAGALAAGAGAALPGGVWAWLQAANASMTGNNSNAGAATAAGAVCVQDQRRSVRPGAVHAGARRHRKRGSKDRPARPARLMRPRRRPATRSPAPAARRRESPGPHPGFRLD